MSCLLKKPGVEIELPGQYSAFRKPLPDRHVKIVSLEDWLEVLRSKEKPRRIKFRGDDAKTYDFLLKGGAADDVRVDARVQSIFGVMNAILKKVGRPGYHATFFRCWAFSTLLCFFKFLGIAKISLHGV